LGLPLSFHAIPSIVLLDESATREEEAVGTALYAMLRAIDRCARIALGEGLLGPPTLPAGPSSNEDRPRKRARPTAEWAENDDGGDNSTMEQ
jgi:hypothetical protein